MQLPTAMPDNWFARHAALSEALGVNIEQARWLVMLGEGLADFVVAGGGRDAAEFYAHEETTPAMYRLAFDECNERLARIVSALVATTESKEDGRLCILEVGAGYGSATEYILPVLTRSCSEYIYTDISQFFLDHGRAQFAADHGERLRFALYNVEEPPAPEIDGRCDMVVAASVLHATERVDVALRNVRDALRPHGVLVLVEETVFHPAFDLTMGLQQGFDRFARDAVRQTHPLLSPAQWLAALASAGFEDAHICTLDAADFSIAETLGFKVRLSTDGSVICAWHVSIVVRSHPLS